MFRRYNNKSSKWYYPLGGSADKCHAIIGFQNPANGSGVDFLCTSNKIDILNNSAAALTLTATTGSNATVGYYNNSTMPTNDNNVIINQINIGITPVI